ncbi:hypothetical protein ZEAMMB73_Zm00001d045446 [Zea mays]|uniref:Uncharacterized protein n=1 Tax=Zea mays TaxID=4577 RepID=A0A1D6NVY9_MAIZE|nr:hypothetical protein ZEAMMB73_Zm00001d045446 [Zea mays]AQL02282.1 hypothetical protein ZEAMMB73_Zm00001d045446 [Zea mays]
MSTSASAPCTHPSQTSSRSRPPPCSSSSSARCAVSCRRFPRCPYAWCETSRFNSNHPFMCTSSICDPLLHIISTNFTLLGSV